MVAGEQGPGLKVEERRAQNELKLNSKWAPHQGYNAAFVDLRAELMLVAKPGGFSYLLTTEGAIPPAKERLASRKARVSEKEFQAMVDDWWANTR